jgi:hypothetical protein
MKYTKQIFIYSLSGVKWRTFGLNLNITNSSPGWKYQILTGIRWAFCFPFFVWSGNFPMWAAKCHRKFRISMIQIISVSNVSSRKREVGKVLVAVFLVYWHLAQHILSMWERNAFCVSHDYFCNIS